MTIQSIMKRVKNKTRELIIYLCRFPMYICPIKQNKIVFCNYSGKGYGDNLKYIANQLLDKKIWKWYGYCEKTLMTVEMFRILLELQNIIRLKVCMRWQQQRFGYQIVDWRIVQ